MRNQHQSSINKLFLVLYYTSLDDKESLEKVLRSLNVHSIISKDLPSSFINLIKYIGIKHLGNQTLLEKVSHLLQKNQKTQILGNKYLIEKQLKENNLIEAEQILKKNSYFKKNLVWVNELKIEMHRKLGNLIKASDVLLKMIKYKMQYNPQLFGEIKDSLFSQAQNSYDKGNFKTAKITIKKLLSLEPYNIEAKHMLIDIYIKKHSFVFANLLIKKLWKIQPSQILLKKFIATHYQLNNLKLFKRLESLLEINSSLNALIAFVKIYIEYNNFNKARELLEQISHKQKTPEFYRLLSEIELKTGGDPKMISLLLDKT